LKVKKFALHVHPYIAAFINQGFISLKWKWRQKYSWKIDVVPNQSLAFLEYQFYDSDKNEIDLKQDYEMK